MLPIEIVRASESEQEALLDCLGDYSIASGMCYDAQIIEKFIIDTMVDEELSYFLAYAQNDGIDEVVGLAVVGQLLSSVAMQPYSIVLGIYTAPDVLSPGIPQSLLSVIEKYARLRGDARVGCLVAQHESDYARFLSQEGYQPDPYIYYSLEVTPSLITSNPNIRSATLEDAGSLAELFNAYRIFYEQPSHVKKSLAFVRARLKKRDSLILVYADPHSLDLAGFVHVYPTYDAHHLAPVWIVNDLFVGQSFRRQGVAEALMHAVQQDAQKKGVLRIELKTGRSNKRAHDLYQKLGYHHIDSERTTFFKEF